VNFCTSTNYLILVQDLRFSQLWCIHRRNMPPGLFFNPEDGRGMFFPETVAGSQWKTCFISQKTFHPQSRDAISKS
jgi:hypothetical protein